jgi:glutamyl-tRNA synthetase
VVPLAEVIEMFDLPQVLRHNARFDINKLHWINGEYIKSMTAQRFNTLAADALERRGIPVRNYPPPYIDAALATAKEKVKQFTELPQFTAFYFKEKVELEPGAQLTADDKNNLQALHHAFAGLETFNVDALTAALKQVAAERKVKIGALVHPTRLACTGSTVGPSLYHLLEVLGKERVLKRFDQAMAMG